MMLVLSKLCTWGTMSS